MTTMEIVVSVGGLIVGFLVVSALYTDSKEETGEKVACPDCRRETGIRGGYESAQSCRWCNGLYWLVSDGQGAYTAVKRRPRPTEEDRNE